MLKPLAPKTYDWILNYVSPVYINNHNNYLPINQVMVCSSNEKNVFFPQIYHQHKICKQTLSALLSIESKQISKQQQGVQHCVILQCLSRWYVHIKQVDTPLIQRRVTLTNLQNQFYYYVFLLRAPKESPSRKKAKPCLN